MKIPSTLSIRYRTTPSINNIIQIQNGTFYRQHPTTFDPSTPQDSNVPLFSNLDFSLPAFPLRRDVSNGSAQQHWAVVGAGGTTTFLEILGGAHISIPANARTFPYLSSDDIEAKDYRLQSPSKAIQYVGFTPGKGLGPGSGTRGSYLSARYESRREETDWSVIQYLKGETELNPAQIVQEKDAGFERLLSQVIKDLRLERLAGMPVSNLSNGQTRRARIAKALLGRPEVLLLDEPFMGLDPPTLVSLSPILRELAYRSSPRLIMSLRSQDPIPDWINHLAILGQDNAIALAGPKEEVLFAVHRWAKACDNQDNGIPGKMAALMTRTYGQPPRDVGHTLSANGISPHVTSSWIISSESPKYILATGEMAPECLTSADQKMWQEAAEKPPDDANIDDLLALTCLLPADFKGRDKINNSAGKASPNRVLRQSKASTPITTPLHYKAADPLIELNNVVVSYGSKVVLGHGIQPGFSNPGLNLTIHRGTRLALLGPNGSGKTTFLSLLTSDHPQSYSLPIKYFGRSRLPSPGVAGLSIWEIQSRIGHSSPEIHAFFPKDLTIRRSLESAWAETFTAKPKSMDDSSALVDAFLAWWEPELNEKYYLAPPAESHATPIGDFILRSYPMFNCHAQTANELKWASDPRNTFGTLPFQSQRLLLFLRAIIKSPDIVILDEGFSGFSSEVREKAMLFLSEGERLVLYMQQNVPKGDLKHADERSPPGTMHGQTRVNRRIEVETICHNMGITVDELLMKKAKLTQAKRDKVDLLRRMTINQLAALAADKSPPRRYAFMGLKPEQALIVVSHVHDEIPDMVNEYVRLPGEEEISEQGRSVELGTCEEGRLRTVEGWSKIWGLST